MNTAPLSKDVVMQLYRRARERHMNRVNVLSRWPADWAHHEPVYLAIRRWFALWLAALDRMRDTGLHERKVYEARLRHKRDRARRGNLHRRRQ